MWTRRPDPLTHLLACGLVLACTSAPSTSAQGPRTASVADVPTAPDDSSAGGVGPLGEERKPPEDADDGKDPLAYYIGTWDGLAIASNYPNGWQTVLVVDGYGSFSVRHESPHGQVCELGGKLQPRPDSVRLDVTHDNCNPQRIGGLERPILSKTADEFVLRAPEYDMIFQYTRRPTPPGD
jgi:hypothetical protein